MQLSDPRVRRPHADALELTERAIPAVGAGELLLRVAVCGVCRTDLDLAEGRLIAPHYPVVPGHQVVATVAGVGAGVETVRAGDRVGVAWINSACGSCRWCRDGEENLCPDFRATGCDVNGGYAEYAVAPAAFCHVLPHELSDVDAAPLLCAGAIGMRSLRLADVRTGDALGLTGFGASAHLMLQIARQRHPDSPIFVFARNAEERAFARSLGAAWAGDATDEPPTPIGAIIDTTPAWKPVVEALRHLRPGGRLVINAIRKSDADKNELLQLDYAAQLWLEREIKSVANVTRADVREVLALAAACTLRPTTEELPLEHANHALAKLRSATAIRGATVLRVSELPAGASAS